MTLKLLLFEYSTGFYVGLKRNGQRWGKKSQAGSSVKEWNLLRCQAWVWGAPQLGPAAGAGFGDKLLFWSREKGWVLKHVKQKPLVDRSPRALLAQQLLLQPTVCCSELVMCCSLNSEENVTFQTSTDLNPRQSSTDWEKSSPLPCFPVSLTKVTQRLC